MVVVKKFQEQVNNAFSCSNWAIVEQRKNHHKSSAREEETSKLRKIVSLQKSSCERNEKLFTALRKKKENVKCCAFKLVINLSFELQRASSKLILTSFIHSICEHTSSATIKRQCRFHCFKSSCFYVWHPLKGNLRVVFVITSGWRKFYVYMSFRDGFSWHMMTKMLFDIIADFNADF